MSDATHVALDGSRVTISMRADLSREATSSGTFNLFGSDQEITAGNLAFGRWAAKAVSGVDLTEEYLYQGGVLSVGSREVENSLTGDGERVWEAVWEGKSRSLEAQIFNLAESSDVVGLLDAFEIQEPTDSSGLILRIVDKRVTPRGAPCILKLIPNAGLVDIERLTSETISSVPNQSGTPVDGGELFLDDSPPSFFLLGNETITTIMPDSDAVLDDVASLLETMTVSWDDPA